MTYQTNPTDETLVLLTLAGDQTAYETLVTRHEKAVIASAMQITHTRFMAEDAAQDALVSAWMKLDTLRDPAKFGGWVCRIARNAAVNMVMRYRSFVDLDTVENTDFAHDPRENPSELLIASEETSEMSHDIRRSVEKLSPRVRDIIRLHYFEGLTVGEIAERMGITQGTVKSGLHDGRRKMRKELCAMNEKYHDTLVEKVMKKVEELKLWQYQNDKSGFPGAYRDVLREVEDLPESHRKYHALADVLMRGWWWIPGEQNDALFEKIREAAILGKNEEVMEFIVTREDGKIWGDEKIRFMRDTQIPKLRDLGFTETLGREWFWLGYYCYDNNEPEEGERAIAEAVKLLGMDNPHRALADGVKKMFALLHGDFKEKNKYRYNMGGSSCELGITEGIPRYRRDISYGEGWMYHDITDLMKEAARADGRFFDRSLAVGETYTASDGTTLTLAADRETVATPAGTYEGCVLFTTRRIDKYAGPVRMKVWYKEGVGIVRFERIAEGVTDSRVLASSRIVGGRGLLPLAMGNEWAYADEYKQDVMTSRLTFRVAYADEEKAVISSEYLLVRHSYDENDCMETLCEIRNEYWGEDEDGHEFIRDVSRAADRALLLAKTPMEKAHAKAAVSVVRRIMATDPTFNPDHTATGHWNFFNRYPVVWEKGTARLCHPRYYAFEWKNTGVMGEALTPILFNDPYGILQDAAQCIWSEEWRAGVAPVVEYKRGNDDTIRTEITCEEGGTVTTKAGVFENCLRVNLRIHGMKDGWSYRGGNKVYIFAPGVGIVRTENEYCGGARTAVYELTSYEGTGEGYMPLKDGLIRRYDAQNLTDGFVGAVEYTYVEEDGELVIFKDATGIRNVPDPVTQYSAIRDEQREMELEEAGKREEARALGGVNNLRVLLHFLGRNSHAGRAEGCAAWFMTHVRMVEMIAEGGEIPPAWLGRYWRASFGAACATFGMGTEEGKAEGYRLLDQAFRCYPKWKAIPDGEALEVGSPLIYGGIKHIKGTGLLLLPDGTKEPIDHEDLLNPPADAMVRGMTAPHGWEWFDPVREDEKFKEYVERAKEMLGESE